VFLVYIGYSNSYSLPIYYYLMNIKSLQKIDHVYKSYLLFTNMSINNIRAIDLTPSSFVGSKELTRTGGRDEHMVT